MGSKSSCRHKLELQSAFTSAVELKSCGFETGGRKMTMFHAIKHYFTTKTFVFKNVRIDNVFLLFTFFIVVQILYNKYLVCKTVRHLNPD